MPHPLWMPAAAVPPWPSAAPNVAAVPAVAAHPDSASSPAWIGLGANLGEPAAHLRTALAGIGALPGTRVVRVSPLYLSAPVDASGPDYLNAVVEICTLLAPQQLLEGLQALERAAGRERPYRNAPRTLDLDILLWGAGGAERIDTATLTVPHPRLHGRAFVLQPLADIAPALVAPAALQAVAGQRMERLPAPL